MNSLRYYIIYILLFFFLSGCVAHQQAQSNLPSPGKQCKILVNKMFAKNTKRKTKKKRIKLHDQAQVDQSMLQAQRMTNEEYLDQIEKVRKSLPSFDVEKDCPPALKKPSKKSTLGSFLKNIF